jgi:hypothetical protein
MEQKVEYSKCYAEMKAVLVEVELNKEVVTVEDFAMDLYERVLRGEELCK